MHLEDYFTDTFAVKWVYDNGYGYKNEHWDCFAGPYWSAGNYLMMLNRDQQVVVLHYKKAEPFEIWTGEIQNKSDFNRVIEFLDQYVKDCGSVEE